MLAQAALGLVMIIIISASAAKCLYLLRVAYKKPRAGSHKVEEGATSWKVLKKKGEKTKVIWDISKTEYCSCLYQCQSMSVLPEGCLGYLQ